MKKQYPEFDTIEEKIDNIKEYLDKIDNNTNREKFTSIIRFILEQFPNLQTRIAWNQPMITDHGTFIIGFWTGTNHLSVAPENTPLSTYRERIEKTGYSTAKKIFRIGWDQKVDYELLKEIVAYTIDFKKDHDKFWE